MRRRGGEEVRREEMMGERMINALMCQMLYQVTDYTGCILEDNSYSGTLYHAHKN